MTGLYDDTLDALTRWAPPDQHQAALREGFLALLLARPDACRRSFVPGHITASTLIMDEAGQRVLLVHHKIVGRWLQVGGHLEDDPTLLHAARREAREESGIDGLVFDPDPIGLDIHAIKCRNSPPTRHFDVRFLAVAPAGAEPSASDESHDARWWPVDALPDVFDEVRELVAAGRARFRQGAMLPP